MPGVDDAAVAARLVLRDLVLLLEHGHRGVRSQLGQAPRNGETDDPRAHDAEPQARHRQAPYDIATAFVSVGEVSTCERA